VADGDLETAATEVLVLAQLDAYRGGEPVSLPLSVQISRLAQLAFDVAYNVLPCRGVSRVHRHGVDGGDGTVTVPGGIIHDGEQLTPDV